MPAEDFATQMEYLSKHGYTTASIDQVAAALRGQGELPPCPIAITFDDAYRDANEIGLPVLQQYGLRATRIYKLKRIGVYFPMSLAIFRARLPKPGPTGAGTCPSAP